MNNHISFSKYLKNKAPKATNKPKTLVSLLHQFSNYPNQEYNLNFNYQTKTNTTFASRKPQTIFDDWITTLPRQNDDQDNYVQEKKTIAPQLLKYTKLGKQNFKSKKQNNQKGIAKLCQQYKKNENNDYTWKCTVNIQEKRTNNNQSQKNYCYNRQQNKQNKQKDNNNDLMNNFQQKIEYQVDKVFSQREDRQKQQKEYQAMLQQNNVNNKLVAYSFASDFVSSNFNNVIQYPANINETPIQTQNQNINQNNDQDNNIQNIKQVEDIEQNLANIKIIQSEIVIKDQQENYKQNSQANQLFIQSKNQHANVSINSALTKHNDLKQQNTLLNIVQNDIKPISTKIVRFESHTRVIYDGLAQFKKYRKNQILNKENNILNQYTLIKLSQPENLEQNKQKNIKDNQNILQTQSHKLQNLENSPPSKIKIQSNNNQVNKKDSNFQCCL